MSDNLDNLDYLEQGFDEQDRGVLKNLGEMGEKLKALKAEYLQAQELADKAKKIYEHYANITLPNEMYALGVDSITLASGGKISVKRNFYCNPNKNVEDKAKIVAWLRENGGGHLVEHDATVAAESMALLKKQHIPFVENTSVNTNSLKAFLKDKLGVTTGVQQIQISDIPSCIHFQEVNTVDLEV